MKLACTWLAAFLETTPTPSNILVRLEISFAVNFEQRSSLWPEYFKLLAELASEASSDAVTLLTKPSTMTLLFASLGGLAQKVPDTLASAATEVIARMAECAGDCFKLKSAAQLKDVVGHFEGPLRARFNAVVPSESVINVL